MTSESHAQPSSVEKPAGYDDSVAKPATHPEHVPTPTFSFELRWPSGSLIKRFVDEPDQCCERFMQDMDEGIFEEIPRARTTIDGSWLEHYRLIHGTVELECGCKFSDYDIPPHATITVVLHTIVTRAEEEGIRE